MNWRRINGRRMKVIIGICVTGLVLVAGSSPLLAQSLLERLEQRLGGLAERAAEANGQRGQAGEDAGSADPDGADPAGAAGKREPGYLGVIVDQEDTAGRGVRVLTVKPKSAAERAGIRDGDLITSINGKTIGGLEEMAEQLAGAPVGVRLAFKLLRGEEQVNVLVTLGRRPAGEGAAPNRPAPPPSPQSLESEFERAGLAERPALGVTVNVVTDSARQRYDLQVARGALVTSVRSGSPADRAGIPLGAVIVAVDGRRIDAPNDLTAALSDAKVGDRIEVAYYEGGRMVRKTVELAAARGISPPALPRLDDPSGGEPPLRLGRDLADRPLLGRLEKALGEFVQPQDAAPPAPSSEVDRLRQEVESLRRHIGRLEGRLETLEQQLGTN